MHVILMFTLKALCGSRKVNFDTQVVMAMSCDNCVLGIYAILQEKVMTGQIGSQLLKMNSLSSFTRKKWQDMMLISKCIKNTTTSSTCP